jgi:hypothetical protein
VEPGKVLVYDGDCPFCSGFSRLGVRLGLYPEERRLAFQDAPAELARRLLEADIANELLVLEASTGELKGGAAGLLWLLSDTWIGPLARLLARGPLLRPIEAVYGFISSNRRLFAAPRPRGVACACEPVDRPARQWTFTALCSSVALATLLLLGRAQPLEPGQGDVLGVFRPLVQAGWPWCLPALLAGTLSQGLHRRYLAHLAATAAAGALVLLPVAVAALLYPAALRGPFALLLQLSCAAAGALMFAMQRKRLAYLGLGRGWLAGWAVCAAFGLATLGWLRELG